MLNRENIHSHVAALKFSLIEELFDDESYFFYGRPFIDKMRYFHGKENSNFMCVDINDETVEFMVDADYGPDMAVIILGEGETFNSLRKLDFLELVAKINKIKIGVTHHRTSKDNPSLIPVLYGDGLRDINFSEAEFADFDKKQLRFIRTVMTMWLGIQAMSPDVLSTVK